jgi:gliding motility-associated-like protein
MTLARSFAIACFFLHLSAGVSGQHADTFDGAIQLSAEQMVMLDSLAADSTITELDIPNVFTPNGDGYNDYFEVTTDGVTVYEFTVFTRTGARVYHSLSPRIFWDGKSNGGKDLKEGVYYYVIEETESSEPFGKAGFMHLFR